MTETTAAARRGPAARAWGALVARPLLLRALVLLIVGAIVGVTAVWVVDSQRLDRAVVTGLERGRDVAEQLVDDGVAEAAVNGEDVTAALAVVAAAGGYERVTLHGLTAGALATVGADTPADRDAAYAAVLDEQRARSVIVRDGDSDRVRVLVPVLRIGGDDGVVLETIASLAPLAAVESSTAVIAAVAVAAAVLLALVPLALVERQRDRRLQEQAGTLAGMLSREARAFGDVNQVQQMKADFLSGVSHGLRTTLHVITGSAQTLTRRGEQLTPEQRVALSTRIAAQAQRFDDLVRDLLEVEALGDGRPARHRTEVLVSDVLHAVRAATDLDAHHLTHEVSGVIVKMAPAHIERVLLHLVRNAVDHTPEGSTIRVVARRQVDGTELVVEDDGPGIPPDERLLVFDPLSRGGAGHADPDPGLGLGLAVVRRVTHLYGGRTWVDDAPAGGAAVHVWIPDVAGSVGVDPFNLPATLDAGRRPTPGVGA